MLKKLQIIVQLCNICADPSTYGINLYVYGLEKDVIIARNMRNSDILKRGENVSNIEKKKKKKKKKKKNVPGAGDRFLHRVYNK